MALISAGWTKNKILIKRNDTCLRHSPQQVHTLNPRVVPVVITCGVPSGTSYRSTYRYN